MKTFQHALQGAEFSITAELSLNGQTTVEEALHLADVLAESVDAIQLADYPDSPARVSPVALAALLVQRGIDPVPWLGCRDRNRIALQSDLLGLRALGVSSIVIDNGIQPAPEDEFRAKPVFDLSCLELVAMANAMSEEEWPEARHEFIIGVRAPEITAQSGLEAENLLAGTRAGARFLQIQPCSSLDLLRGYMQSLVEAKVTWNLSVIASFDPLPSAGLLREVAAIPGISGVNLLTPGNPGAVKELIDASGLR